MFNQSLQLKLGKLYKLLKLNRRMIFERLTICLETVNPAYEWLKLGFFKSFHGQLFIRQQNILSQPHQTAIPFALERSFPTP